MLKERKWVQKAIYHMIPFLWHSGERQCYRQKSAHLIPWARDRERRLKGCKGTFRGDGNVFS